MERITETEVKNFERPNRQMTLRETVIWNEVNRRATKKETEKRIALYRKCAEKK